MTLTPAQRGLLRGSAAALLLAALALLLFQAGSRAASSAPANNMDLLPSMPLPTDYLLNARPDETADGRSFYGRGPLVVPASAFNLDGFAGDYYYAFAGGYLYPQGTGTSCYSAPLYLPNGEPIVRFTVHGYDAYEAQNFGVALNRVRWGTSAGLFNNEVLATVTSSGSDGLQTLTTSSINRPIIDQRNYFYYLTACMPGAAGTDLRLHGVEILFLHERTFLPTTNVGNIGGLTSCPFFAESEPNDAYTEADGPLCSNTTFTGDPNANGSAQDSDYFTFEVSAAGTISVEVVNYLTSKAQVQLYYGTPTSPVAFQADQLSGTYAFDYEVPPGETGTYYLRLVALQDHATNTGTYVATVVFP